jgi:flagellar assembly factor FliW
MRSVGATKNASVLAFATVVLGKNATDSTANLQAPLLINFDTMQGHQMILAESGYSVMHPILPPKPKVVAMRAAAAGAR